MSVSQHEHLFRRIVKSNDRLKQFKAMQAPEIILRNERRVLQDALRAMRETRLKFGPPTNDPRFSTHAA